MLKRTSIVLVLFSLTNCVSATDVSAANTVCEQIKSQLPKVKSGSLRMWGQWFGRPYDNVHIVTDCSAVGNAIKITFDGAEELTVWQPDGVNITQTEFQIDRASRVRWDWLNYGQSQTPSNRYYVDYSFENGVLKLDSNVDFYAPKIDLESMGPAAEIL